jgi:hypothetical protein
MTDSNAERITRATQALTLVGYGNKLDVRSAMLTLLGDLRCAADHHGLDVDSLGTAFQQSLNPTAAAPGGEAAGQHAAWPDPENFTDIDDWDEEEEIEFDSSGNPIATGPTYNERQTRPLAEQTLDDFDEFFCRCPGMTCIFLVPGDVNTVYPNVDSAIQMADCFWRGAKFAPAVEEEASLRPSDSCSRQEIISEVQARVAEMDRRGAEFGLIWNLAGDPEVRFDSSEGMEGEEEIGRLLADEVRDLSQYC